VRLTEQLLVAGVLPHHQPLDQVEQPLELDVLLLDRRELLRVRRRVVDRLGEQDRPARRQRLPGPPQVHESL